MTGQVQEWARQEKVTLNQLYRAAAEVTAGQVEANLGSGLYKKRIALEHKGKSGGARALLA